MKKIFLFASVVALLTACNANNDDDTVITTEKMETPVVDGPVVAHTYTPGEGDVIFKEDHAMVWRGGEWVKVEENIILDNGAVVYPNGEVKKEGKTVKLKEGEVVNSVGEFFDKTGEAISDAWKSAKEGVKDAGKAVEGAAKDIKESVDGKRD